MLPELLLAGRFHVSLWALAAFVAAVVVFVSALRQARRARVDPALVWEVWPWAFLGGCLGARLYYLLAVGDAPPLLSWSSWSGLNIMRGTSIQGAMLGGLLGFVLCMRRRRLPVLPLLDAFAPGAPLVHAITRLGCFSAGCCWGRPTTMPWGVVFTNQMASAPRGVALHPAQLYESALDLVLAWYLHRRLAAGDLPAGGVFWRYLGGYSAIRLIVQFLRDDDAGHLVLGLAHSQYLALFTLAVVLTMLRTPPPSRRRAPRARSCAPRPQ